MNELAKVLVGRQLVDQLIILFKGMSEEKIDGIVTATKKQIRKDGLDTLKNELTEKFLSQIETLKKTGCPTNIIKILESKLAEVVDKAAGMEFPEVKIPFLPIIPKSFLGLYGLINMVEYNGKRGETHLDPMLIINKTDTPVKPYFIYGVADGEGTINSTLNHATKFVERQDRKPLTSDEGIALCLHTKVLDSHAIYCLNSSYDGQKNSIIQISIKANRPLLDWANEGNIDKNGGSPSCSSLY
jgi:hypothetical protein